MNVTAQNATTIRCDNDLEFYNTLLAHRDVKKVNEYIKKKEDEGPTGIRRRLLATSVRLSKSMASDIHKMADECVERLEMDIPLELYVFASPQFNAMCFKPEEGRLFVMFASSLLEAFTESELRFVMGHEFGHHVYKHHDIPIGYLLNGKPRPNPRMALDLFAWSRYAEISADRAGAHCARDMDAVARSLFKLSSGLTGKLVNFDMNEFLKQVDDMQVEDAQPDNKAPQQDWFSTHPFSPLRVKALKQFDESVLANGNTSKSDLEISVQGLMALMEPSYLEAKTDKAIQMRRLLYAVSVAVADASDGIDEKEIEVLEQFFGKGEFRGDISVDRIKATIPDRISKTREDTTVTQRMQVMRDLCLVAKASGHTTEAEREVLNETADALNVPRAFVCQSMEQAVEPD